MSSDLGGRMKELRELTGLTSRELSRIAGLKATGHARHLETASLRERVSACSVEKVAAVFGVSIDWLFAGKGDRPSDRHIRASVTRARRSFESQVSG